MANYKKIRDLSNFVNITPDHLVPVSTPLGAGSESTGNTTAKNFFGSVINNSSTFQLDADGNLEIKPGGIKSEDLSDESVSTGKLKTTGTGAIDVQSIVRKNIIVHVGNYQRQGTKYWASDSLGFNGTVYGPRTTDVVQFAGNANHPDPYFGYYSSGSSDEVVEPFATVTAAARYCLHNHGSDISAVFLIHGHVAWSGAYDMNPGSYTILDVNNWTPFLNVGITAGIHPDDPGNGSDYLNCYSDTAIGAARIDVDHGQAGYAMPPGMWFRAPTMYMSGINFVMHNCKTDGKVAPNFEGGKGAGGFHELRGLKWQLVGGANFTPYRMASDFFFSSGANMPHEIHTTTANMNPFEINGAGGIYSNNATSNGLYLSSDKASCGIDFVSCNSGGFFHFKMSQCYSRANSTFSTTKDSLRQTAGYSTLVFEGNDLTTTDANGVLLHQTGGGTKTWLPGNGGYMYKRPNGDESALYQAEGYYFGSRWNHVTGSSSLTRGYMPTLLENRMANWSTRSSLLPTVISGNSTPKSSPAARQGTGGTDSAFAPYSDQ